MSLLTDCSSLCLVLWDHLLKVVYGSQGDILSGTLATFVAWVTSNSESAERAAAEAGVPPLMLAAYGAACTVRHASQTAFRHKRRSMLAGDVIEELGATVDRLFDGASS